MTMNVNHSWDHDGDNRRRCRCGLLHTSYPGQGPRGGALHKYQYVSKSGQRYTLAELPTHGLVLEWTGKAHWPHDNEKP